jgi:uncharacterized membrane protein YeaQ/YmgE (transglycosylase-associated protein family)
MTGGGPTPRPPGNGSDCAKLHEQTTLNSVDPNVLSTIKKDDILTIHAQSPRGPLVVLNQSGGVVGSITSASLAKILDCINDGFEYVAIVQSVKGGQVIVLIRPK